MEVLTKNTQVAQNVYVFILFQLSGYFSRIQSVGAVREVSEVKFVNANNEDSGDHHHPLPTSKNHQGVFITFR